MKRKETDYIGFRLGEDLNDFVVKRSQRSGVSKSELVRNLIIQGATAESVADFEERMLDILEQMKSMLAIASGGSGRGMNRFDRLALYETLTLLRINAAKTSPSDVKQAQALAQQMLEEIDKKGE